MLDPADRYLVLQLLTTPLKYLTTQFGVATHRLGTTAIESISIDDRGGGAKGVSCPPNNVLVIFPNHANSLSFILRVVPPYPQFKIFCSHSKFFA